MANRQENFIEKNFIEDGDILDLLTSLVDKSLVIYEEDNHGKGRYRLLETVRQYGQTQLAEQGEETLTHERHQSYFLTLAEKADALLSGPDQIIWLECLDREHDNMRSALDWSFESENGVEATLRLSAALATHWLLRGDYSEGRQWLSRSLKRDEQKQGEQISTAEKHRRAARRSLAHLGTANLDWSCGDAIAARLSFEQALDQARDAEEQTAIAYALRGLGMCLMSHEMVQDDSTAQALFEESLQRFRQVNNTTGITFALRNLGDLAEFQQRYAAAREFYGESLTLSRQLENKHGIAGSLISLARVAFAQGDFEAAQALHEEALSLSRQFGDQGAIIHSLSRLGQVAFLKGDLSLAQTLHEQALPIARRLGHPENIAFSLACLGRVALRQGDTASAWDLHTESLLLRRQAGHFPALAYGLSDFAEMAQCLHQPRRAALLLGASHTLRQTSGAHWMPVEEEEQTQQIASVRADLGEETFAAAFATGQAMPLPDALEYALAQSDT